MNGGGSVGKCRKININLFHSVCLRRYMYMFVFFLLVFTCFARMGSLVFEIQEVGSVIIFFSFCWIR